MRDGRRTVRGSESTVWIWFSFSTFFVFSFVTIPFPLSLRVSSTTSSSTVWILYLEFELRLARRLESTISSNIKKSKKDSYLLKSHLERIKGLIYRAIRLCPWCKGESVDSSSRFPLEQLNMQTFSDVLYLHFGLSFSLLSCSSLSLCL